MPFGSVPLPRPKPDKTARRGVRVEACQLENIIDALKMERRPHGTKPQNGVCRVLEAWYRLWDCSKGKPNAKPSILLQIDGLEVEWFRVYPEQEGVQISSQSTASEKIISRNRVSNLKGLTCSGCLFVLFSRAFRRSSELCVGVCSFIWHGAVCFCYSWGMHSGRLKDAPRGSEELSSTRFLIATSSTAWVSADILDAVILQCFLARWTYTRLKPLGEAGEKREWKAREVGGREGTRVGERGRSFNYTHGNMVELNMEDGDRKEVLFGVETCAGGTPAGAVCTGRGLQPRGHGRKAPGANGRADGGGLECGGEDGL